MARLSVGLSQENVATELGLKTGTYSNIETGKTNITVLRLAEIARILGKGMGELLGLESELIMNDGAMIYRNAFGQQIVLLSEQVGALKLQLDQLEGDVRKLEGKDPSDG